MHIGITVWDNRISPVFDSARTLLVVQAEQESVQTSRRISFQSTSFPGFLRLLEELQVEVLICGALCAGPAMVLESRGIEVLSFLTGEADQVLEQFLCGADLSEMMMPGCARKQRCCLNQGRQRRLREQAGSGGGKQHRGR